MLSGIAHPLNTVLRAQDIAAIMRAAGSRVLVALDPQAGSDLWEKAVAAARETTDIRAVVARGEADPGSRYVHLASQLPSEDGPLPHRAISLLSFIPAARPASPLRRCPALWPLLS